jgi:ABC-type Mn2+/Zn2+ transport system permease subunit
VDRQLTLWAQYPTRTLVRRAAVAALIGAGLHLLLGVSLVNRGAPLQDALRGAVVFGVALGVFGGGTSWWARRQARRGRRVWWLAGPRE